MRLALLAFIPLALLAQKPDCSILPGSTQSGQAREFDTETLYEYMNGNSEGYFLYGFVRMHGVTCKKGDINYVVDLSEFKSPELAYGMFTGNLDPRRPTDQIGAGGQTTDAKLIFVKGQWLGEIAAEPEGPHQAALRAAGLEFAKKISGSTDKPVELGWFAKDGLQPGSPRLVPQSLLGLRMLERGYLAQYDQGKAWVMNAGSADAAKALLGKLKERFPPTGEVKAGDEGFAAEDRYLGRIAIFRKGARLGGWANVPAGKDPAQLATELAGRIP